MIKKIEITNLAFAREIVNIQMESYKEEAKLIGFYDIPTLRDTVHSIQQSDEVFYGYFENDLLAGAISFKIKDDVLDIHRLMVHPEHFRKGIATILLEFIESKIRGISTIVVSTGTKNTPAINFYKKCGFSKTGESMVPGNVSITSFAKEV